MPGMGITPTAGARWKEVANDGGSALLDDGTRTRREWLLTGRFQVRVLVGGFWHRIRTFPPLNMAPRAIFGRRPPATWGVGGRRTVGDGHDGLS